MTNEQHFIINASCIYTSLMTVFLISVICVSGYFNVHHEVFLSDSLIQSLIILLGVNVLGIIGLIIRWLFKE